MHSALTIEEALVKQPKLGVYVMHAGYGSVLLDSAVTRRDNRSMAGIRCRAVSEPALSAAA